MENTKDTFTLLVAGRALSVDKQKLHEAQPALQKLTLLIPSTVRGLTAVWNGLDRYFMRGYPSAQPVPGLSLPITLGQS